MAYIPSGFWSRLITRLIVSVQRWRAIEHIKEESYSLVYWREGIGVVYEGGHFQVESYQELVKYSLLVYRCLECKKIYLFRLFFVVVAVSIVVRLFVCLFVFSGQYEAKVFQVYAQRGSNLFKGQYFELLFLVHPSRFGQSSVERLQ